MQVRSFFRRKLIVHDENDRFVELSGWRWTIVSDDAGAVVQQFEGNAEVITTDQAELAALLGRELVGASEAAAAARAAELHAQDRLREAEADLASARARIIELDAANAALALDLASRKAGPPA